MNGKQLKDIQSVLSRLATDKDAFSMLLEFERTLDKVDLYAYENWFNGELVAGPQISRYWVTCVFMYPYKMMPDPEGALRLEKYGCEVSFEEDIFKNPVRVRDSSDYENQYNKKAKIKKHKVWLVTIKMPRRFIDEEIDDAISFMKDVDVDVSDIAKAYDENQIKGLKDDDSI